MTTKIPNKTPAKKARGGNSKDNRQNHKNTVADYHMSKGKKKC